MDRAHAHAAKTIQDADANRRLLGRLFDALLPDFRLAIIDALPNDQLDGPRSVAL